MAFIDFISGSQMLPWPLQRHWRTRCGLWVLTCCTITPNFQSFTTLACVEIRWQSICLSCSLIRVWSIPPIHGFQWLKWNFSSRDAWTLKRTSRWWRLHPGWGVNPTDNILRKAGCWLRKDARSSYLAIRFRWVQVFLQMALDGH